MVEWESINVEIFLALLLLFLIIMQWSGEKTFLIWKFIHGNFVFRYSHIFAPALSLVLHGARRVYVCEFVSMESQQPHQLLALPASRIMNGVA